MNLTFCRLLQTFKYTEINRPFPEFFKSLRWYCYKCYITELTVSLPECLMEVCKVTLTFESVDEILRCDHSNESSLPTLPHSAICFSKLYKIKFANLLEICPWLHLAVKGLSHCTCIILRTCSFVITTTYRLWLINEVNDRLSTTSSCFQHKNFVHRNRKMALGIT